MSLDPVLQISQKTPNMIHKRKDKYGNRLLIISRKLALQLRNSPPQTETDLAEQSPLSLPSWTAQGYKVSTEEYYRTPSELKIIASLAILAENANVRS